MKIGRLSAGYLRMLAVSYQELLGHLPMRRSGCALAFPDNLASIRHVAARQLLLRCPTSCIHAVVSRQRDLHKSPTEALPVPHILVAHPDLHFSTLKIKYSQFLASKNPVFNVYFPNIYKTDDHYRWKTTTRFLTRNKSLII